MSIKRVVVDASAALKWFFTGDKKLFNAVGTALTWVKWIGDYQFEIIPATTDEEPKNRFSFLEI